MRLLSFSLYRVFAWTCLSLRPLDYSALHRTVTLKCRKQIESVIKNGGGKEEKKEKNRKRREVRVLLRYSSLSGKAKQASVHEGSENEW